MSDEQYTAGPVQRRATVPAVVVSDPCARHSKSRHRSLRPLVIASQIEGGGCLAEEPVEPARLQPRSADEASQRLGFSLVAAPEPAPGVPQREPYPGDPPLAPLTGSNTRPDQPPWPLPYTPASFRPLIDVTTTPKREITAATSIASAKAPPTAPVARAEPVRPSAARRPCHAVSRST